MGIEDKNLPVWRKPYRTSDVRKYQKGKGWFQIRTEIEALLTRILQKDLARVNSKAAYIVLSSESFPLHYCLAGVASVGFCGMEAIRGAIGCRWNGPGPVSVINDSEFGHYPYYDFRRTLEIGLHEITHPAVSGTYFISGEITPPESHVRIVQELASNPHEWPQCKTTRYGMHGWPFCRMLLHVAARAERIGYPTHLAGLMDWGSFGYRNPEAYKQDLSAEIESFIDAPLYAVMDTKPPANFIERFHTDQEHAEYAKAQSSNQALLAAAVSI